MRRRPRPGPWTNSAIVEITAKVKERGFLTQDERIYYATKNGKSLRAVANLEYSIAQSVGKG